MVNAFKSKSNDLYEYNKSILTKNTSRVVDGSKQLFDTFFTLIMGDEAPIHTDDDDLMYKRLYDAKMEALNPERISTQLSKYEYETFLDMVKSFDKCSTLFSTSETLVPFPMLEVSIYTVMIVFLLIIMIAVTLTMQPKQRMEDMRRYVRVKARLHNRSPVEPDELPSTCENDVEKRKINNMIKFVAIVLLVILPIMFSVTLGENIATFSSTIYLSDYFAKSDCYA